MKKKKILGAVAALFAAIVCAIYMTRGGGLRAYPSENEVRRFIKRNEIDFDYKEAAE